MTDQPDELNTNRKRALTPEDLDFTAEENVVVLEDGRFVISTDGPPKVGSVHQSDQHPTPESKQDPITKATVEEWLANQLTQNGGQYGFILSAKFDEAIHHRRFRSNDIVRTFEQLVIWYAEHLDEETPVEEVIGILATEANLPIADPKLEVQSRLETHGINADEPISELLAVLDVDRNRSETK